MIPQHKDEYIPFYKRVEAEQKDILAALKMTVRIWTEKEMDAGHNPTFGHFLDAYPEWDHEELHIYIGEELFHAKHGLPNTSEAI